MTPKAHDLVVVGGGLTGLAAAWRALQLGLRPLVLASTAGSLPHTSGALDLLGVYPTETKHFRKNPWEALLELTEREPRHPYSKVGVGAVRRAWELFVEHLEQGPLSYRHQPGENVLLVTAAGTLKPTYAVPRSMWNNVRALRQRWDTVVLGLDGLVDFSPELVVQTLAPRWPALRAARVDGRALLGGERRVRAAELASALERAEVRAELVQLVRPCLGSAQALGLPAVLGLERAAEICAELERELQVRVFEIPLLTPSIPGMRLAQQLRRELEQAGVDLRQGRPVVGLEATGGRVSAVVWSGVQRERRFPCRQVLLATGRFFGGGLVAAPNGVSAPLLGMTLEAPAARDQWHMESFLGAPGHPINRVGLSTDALLRPVTARGELVFDNLFAAGAILEAHDWVREKSGAGISVASGIHVAELMAGQLAGERGAREVA